jgi:alpha-galactosidase
LWLDVSNGGDGVMLGSRVLPAATVVTRQGMEGEPAIAALREFCKKMCPAPRLPKGAVYGGNDWYCAYGKNSQDMLFRIADLMAEMAPAQGPRPWTVVDMGWKDGSTAFPSMAGFADEVRKRGVRPGIWIRPLEAPEATNERLLLPAGRFGGRSERGHDFAFDPTVPEASALVERRLRELAEWKFELVKHDYSTYDLLGQWGFEMGARPSIPGWHFNDRSRTNAEVILDFYRMVRSALGEGVQIMGCNTMGHLGAGIFEIQRTGDDTSGQIWERTRRMGVNTLAFRLPQHRTFFHLDADCVGITKAVPWELNRHWLDLVASSGTALFVSPQEGATGVEQRKALREAFAMVVSPQAGAWPVDFFHETTPEAWQKRDGSVKQYPWCAARGAWPFTV